MFAGLSLDQAPPFDAPLKFFLTAPLFAIVAGLLLLFSNEFTIHSQYLIATIHFITIGYMIMIVFGALQQMLPVIAGAVIPKPVIVANITYWSIIVGLIRHQNSIFCISNNFNGGDTFFYQCCTLSAYKSGKQIIYCKRDYNISYIFYMCILSGNTPAHI